MTEEEISERNRAYEQAIAQKSAMVALKDDTRFKLFQAGLQKQIDARFTESLNMPMGLDSVVSDLYKKGEMAGLKLAIDYADVMIEFAQANILTYRATEDEKDGRTQE